jgi:hypothetical protein
MKGVRGARRIMMLSIGIWEYQSLPEEFDDGAYDDILERIRARRSLDLLGGSPDLGGEEGLRFRIGPPYRWQLERQAKAQEEAQRVERVRRQVERIAERRNTRWREELARQSDAAWSKVRLEPVSSGSTVACAECGLAQEILLPPPGAGWTGGNMMCGGKFWFECERCSSVIGMHSRRLTAECEELRRIIRQHGWNSRFIPRTLPPRVQPILDRPVC